MQVRLIWPREDERWLSWLQSRENQVKRGVLNEISWNSPEYWTIRSYVHPWCAPLLLQQRSAFFLLLLRFLWRWAINKVVHSRHQLMRRLDHSDLDGTKLFKLSSFKKVLNYSSNKKALFQDISLVATIKCCYGNKVVPARLRWDTF